MKKLFFGLTLFLSIGLFSFVPSPDWLIVDGTVSDDGWDCCVTVCNSAECKTWEL